jgi:alginate O-acetyltransferase complex protein AlgI
MLFGYSMQIFADFAGYSLIAIGIARLFGYELMENFNYPYISQSLSEFWRRWHISLSTWLREYLYFPLGGNRRGEFRTYLNLMIVMILGGLWHGAAWSYAVWGTFHGAGLAMERWWQKGKVRTTDRPFSWWRAVLVFCYVTIAWLLFKLPNFDHVLAFLRSCATNWRLPADTRLIAFVMLYSLPVLFYHALALRKSRGYRIPPIFQQLAYATCIIGLLINSGSSGAFIYFQF